MATDTENTGKVTTYLYDDLGRLTSEAITGTNNNSTLTYTYDDRGNRLTQSRGNATVTYTYDLNNRLTSHTASGVVTTYVYDNNGNTISTYVGGNYGGGYTYDLFNRQKTYTPDGTVFTTTTYRPDGMRHSIGNTKHIWDNGNIVGDISGSTYKQYFRALNLIYNLVGTTKQYYRYNGHGDVVALTNASGTVVKTYTYNAFGEEQNIDNLDANPFRYCGEYFDKVSGTLYLRARNYNASIGRFTQEDPIRADGNFYAYCGSNPVNAHDPSGLKAWYIDVDGNMAPVDPERGNGSNDTENEQKETYIYSQKNDPRTVGQKYGAWTMDRNGCEIIAIYNAMISLGDPQSLDSIIEWGEENALWFFGIFGTEPRKIGDYFKATGYDVDCIKNPTADELKSFVDSYDVVVFSYWTPIEFLFLHGVHTVMIEKSENGGTGYDIYNRWSGDGWENKAGGYNFTSDECINGKLIYAYGINRK